MAVILFAGCQRTIDPYTPKISFKTNAIGKVKINTEDEVEIHQYDSFLACTLQSIIITPDKKSYGNYIENAFVSELKQNNLYSDTDELNLINIHFKFITVQY